MSETALFQARLRGRDATHRTRNLDTHLTHGCIQLFCHFSRIRFDYRECRGRQNRRFPEIFESALRTLAGAVR
jgi:hypothetical protein